MYQDLNKILMHGDESMLPCSCWNLLEVTHWLVGSCPSEGGNEPSTVNIGEGADFDSPFDISVINSSEVKKVWEKSEYIKELTDGCYALH